MGIVALDAESVRGSSTRGAGLQPAITDPAGQRPAPREFSWHDEFKRAIRDPYKLVAALELPAEFIEPACKAAETFPLFAPWPYVVRMRQGDPSDPLLRQVLPLADELDSPPGFTSDAVGDSAAMLSP